MHDGQVAEFHFKTPLQAWSSPAAFLEDENAVDVHDVNKSSIVKTTSQGHSLSKQLLEQVRAQIESV